MFFFKSKEEKEAERRQREAEQEQLVQRISESPMTKHLQHVLLELFGDLNGEEVIRLRTLSANRGGCHMEVRGDGILFNLIMKDETVDKWAITFDSLGYQNLPSAGVCALEKILVQTLNSIPHLRVGDSGYILYDQNRAKQSW